jgi:serpin B
MNIRYMPLCLVLVWSGCGEQSPPEGSCAECDQGVEPPEGAGLYQSSLDRETPEVSAEARDRLVEGLTGFAVDLYQSIRGTEEGNILLSPQSIATALAMTYAGAEGDTAVQMADALHCGQPRTELLPAFNELDALLASRGRPGVELQLINALWTQEGYPFEASYLDSLAVNFGAALYGVDFAASPEGARTLINDWVASETSSRIEELLPEGVVDSLTRLVLTNAVYFNASWQEAFDAAQTADGDFIRADGTSVSVPMMAAKSTFFYGETESFRAVELPYSGEELSLLAILPKADHEELDLRWTGAEVGALADGLSEQELTLRFPRFSFSFPVGLKAHLQNLGMTDAFLAGQADFSGMDGTRELYVQDVVHQAFIEVTEEGTEAAAATGVVVGVRSAGLTVAFDRPFLFVIRDRGTGAILFLGRLADPSA